MAEHKTGILDSIADLSFHKILFHPVMLMVLATTGTIILGSITWQHHKSEIVNPQDFSIGKETLILPDHPSWVPDNWADIAIRDSRLEEVSILDPEAVETIASALAVQPWVRRINRVEKRRNEIVIDLDFREPVAMVEIGKLKLVPVDGDGFILDGGLFTPQEVNSYMRISIPFPFGGPAITGQAWPDSRIIGCAAIAEAWQGKWQDIKLLRVVNRAPSKAASKPINELPAFELFTTNQTPIIWGSIPGEEKKNEATAEEKVSALIEFANTQRQLDQLKQGIGLDVRTGQVRQAPMSLTSQFDDGSEQIR